MGPHPELARILLECETSGGYPEPSLVWWRNGRIVDDSYELVSATDGQVLERRGGEGVPTTDTDNELMAADGGGRPNEEQAGRLGRPAMALDARRQQSSDSSISLEQQPTTATSAQANRLIRNRLELVGLTRDDLLANYSCQASNSKLGEPPTSYVMIDMNRKYLVNGARSFSS